MRKRCKRTVRASNPVQVAMAKESMKSTLRSISLRAYMTQDGECDLDLISQLAMVIAVGAEVSIKLDADLIRTKRLHSALRTLIAMAVNGGAWQASQAPLMHQVAEESHALSMANVAIALGVYPGALYLCDRIASGKAEMADVAGAEIYAEAA